MPRVVYVQPTGTQQEVELTVGSTVMSGALTNGISGIDGDWGGQCAWGTCRVYSDDEGIEGIGPAGERESKMLMFAAAVQPNSRLGCQITIDRDLEGLTLYLPDGQH